VLLAMHGHPEAHEAARVVARDARQKGRPLAQLLRENTEIAEYLRKMSPAQLAILDDPAHYLGAAAQRTRAICDAWEKRLAALPI
jgi:adenylosuccinate lyase